MERRANRRLIAIISLGIALCTVGMGVRMFHRKPIHGTWLGYSYMEQNGKRVRDEQFGQYLIKLNLDGTYSETSNSTSGTWKRVGDKITLVPAKFYDMTPDELTKKYRKSDGTPSATMTRLLTMKMKPFHITYQVLGDRLIHEEPTLHYEYERSN